MLRVSALHEIYYEECGNPRGKPALFVHGGPGAGAGKDSRRFFDPKRYRIVLFDQRGCGRSRPHASLVDNTTWHLVEDMERLREHLGIERWLVFGGSWGSTLSPRIRADTSATRDRAGAARHFPAATGGDSLVLPGRAPAQFFPIPGSTTSRRSRRQSAGTWWPRSIDGLPATIRRVALDAANAWSIWEAATSYLHVNQENIARWSDDEFAMAVARIECHYFVNRGFFEHEDQLLRNAAAHPACARGDRARTLRCGLPDDERVGSASRLAGSRVPRRAGCRAFRDGARHPARADQRHGSICALSRRRASAQLLPSLGQSAAHPRRSACSAAAKRALRLRPARTTLALNRDETCNPRRPCRSACARGRSAGFDQPTGSAGSRRRSLRCIRRPRPYRAPRGAPASCRCSGAASCSTECSGVSRRANSFSPFRPASVSPQYDPGISSPAAISLSSSPKRVSSVATTMRDTWASVTTAADDNDSAPLPRERAETRVFLETGQPAHHDPRQVARQRLAQDVFLVFFRKQGRFVEAVVAGQA